MAGEFQTKSRTSAQALANAASQASTVTGAALNIAAMDWEGLFEVTQNVGAITGSITGKIQDSADGSTGWADVTDATFAAVSAANNTQRLVIDAKATRGFIRYVGTIVTGPALVSVTASGAPKQ
jgi:hypothetical protein